MYSHKNAWAIFWAEPHAFRARIAKLATVEAELEKAKALIANMLCTLNVSRSVSSSAP